MAEDIIVFRDFDPSFKTGVDGDIGSLINVEAIYGSLENILLTITGERVMLRNFPGILPTMLMEPLSGDALRRTAEQQLSKTIQKWDDRIRVSSLDITIDQDNDSIMLNGQFYIQGYDQVFTLQKILK
jgi:phage baseplate assembly protein W